MLLHNQGQSFDWVIYRMVRTLQGVKPGMNGFLLLALSEDQIQRMFFLPVCSSSMCIFNVIEQSGKELLKCSMSWAVIVSIGLCSYFIHVLVHACTLKAYLAPLQ